MPQETDKQKLFEDIAREHLHIETLKTQDRDKLDFHDVSVWAVRAALEAAYQAGRADASGR